MFSRLTIAGTSSDSIIVNGDSTTEQHWTDVRITNPGAIGFKYTRTTTTDTGGMYLTNINVARQTAGTSGFSFVSTAGTRTGIFLFCNMCIADGFNGAPAWDFNNVQNVNLSQVWGISAGALIPAFRFTKTAVAQLSNIYAAANIYDIQFISAVLNDTQLFTMDGVYMTGGGTALRFEDTNSRDINIRNYYFAGTLTNDETQLINSQKKQPPDIFLVSGAGGSNTSVAIKNVDAGAPTPNKYLRVDASGSLQILNNAFSAGILTLSDSGILAANNNISSTGAFISTSAGINVALNDVVDFDTISWNAALRIGKNSSTGMRFEAPDFAFVTGLFSSYAGIATVSKGIPAEYATVDLTAQGAAIAATTIYAVPASGAGMYRISFVAKVTQAATTSSVLGGTNGFRVVYTDQNDSVVVTTPAGHPYNSTTANLALNTTQAVYSGVIIINAALSTNIQYSIDWTSVGATPMQYNLHIKVEAM